LKISGNSVVPVPPNRAYTLLQDPVILAKCMPGTDHLAKIGEDEYEMKMKMVIASISGLFAGKVKIAEQNPPTSFKLIVEGSGKIGFVKGEGVLNLSPDGDSSTGVKYDGDVQVGGTIAAVGQRLLDATSKLIIKKFFQKFSEAAKEGAAQQASAPPEVPQTQEATTESVQPNVEGVVAISPKPQ
jgi:carbon monoxide dehydrogenase subunit G